MSWLQDALLNSCFIKLALNNKVQQNTDYYQHINEPVAYHSICNNCTFICYNPEKTAFYSAFYIFLVTVKNLAVPIVSWNSEQTIALLDEPFMLLLHKLGFHLPADTGKPFIRIPAFWSAEVLYITAEKLGSINKCK